MSLCIATAVPDGIVFSSDTLQSMNAIRNNVLDLTCNTCKTQHKVPINIPFSIGTFPTAQKQHHLRIVGGNSVIWSLGVLNAGALNIGSKRISQLIRTFEQTVKITDTIDSIAANMKDFFVAEVLSSFKIQKIEDFNGDTISLALCGYDRNDKSTTLPKKFVIQISKSPSVKSFPGYGAVWVGKIEIPSMFNDPAFMRNFGLESINLLFDAMNVQDAIDYNRFLINTTMGYQKFAPMAPDVGGDIELGVLCRDKEYMWIKRMEWF